jgi:hypothetical protein
VFVPLCRRAVGLRHIAILELPFRRSRGRTACPVSRLSDANALATFVALQALEKTDPAAYGAVAVAIQRCFAEHIAGTDQAPMTEV